MLRSVRERLTYSNVMATTAVFVALGGTSYAVASLPRNSVGTNQIRSEGVRSGDIRDRGITLRDISRDARESLEGQRGPAGARGAIGLKGDKGDPGITQVVNVDGSQIKIGLTIKTQGGTVAASDGETTQPGSATATCDGTQRVTGGGVRFDNPTGTTVLSSGPSGAGAWVAHVGSDATSARTFTVFAICTT
jgi:hypothetical protein